MSIQAAGSGGSATIMFRKVFDSGTLTADSFTEILSYPVDVDWIEVYMNKPR